jgi:transcriptional regulator with PAS, ATPase and Fis domain
MFLRGSELCFRLKQIVKHMLQIMKQPHADLASWLGAVGPAQAFEGLTALFPGAAVFAVDRERNVVSWSEGASALLGYAPDEVLGQHCLKANRCQECMRGCGIAEHGQVDGVPLTLYRPDGEPVRLRKTARAFFDESGAFAGGIEVLLPDRQSAAPVPPEDGEIVAFHGIVTRDEAMKRVIQTIRNVAETTATTLVRGESGTGKELVARALHGESARRGGPFVAVNCAALTPSLMESELFGHEKGAFTGAVRDRAGIFQQASGGTLLLDEVAELPLELQAKLLRVIEERAVVPVGGSAPLSVDVRLVAATHRSLRKEVAAGRFREDLMYRLRVVPIFLPPLRERRGDLELLIQHFIRHKNVSGPRIVEAVAPDAMRRLLEHRWPGNVRELRNVIEYAFAVGRGPELLSSELPPELHDDEPAAPLAIDDEAAQIRRALAAVDGHVGKAAALLGVSRPTLWRKRKKLGL